MHLVSQSLLFILYDLTQFIAGMAIFMEDAIHIYRQFAVRARPTISYIDLPQSG